MQCLAPRATARRALFQPYGWIAPALAFVALLKFYPIGFSLALSFFDWNVFQPDPFGRFVGLANYIELARDRHFLGAFQHTLIYTAAALTLQLGLAYGLAVFFYLGDFAAGSALRGILFFPGVLSAVLVGQVWRVFVFLRGGLIHRVTTALGLPDVYLLPEQAFPIVVGLGLWQFVGYNVVIFYAGLQAVNRELLEAAQIDGADFWQVIRFILTPLQRRTMLVVAMLNVISAVQLFDLPRVMGGNVLATYLVNQSFGATLAGRLGYASGISVVMMLMCVIFAALRARARRALED
jgi:ABC-type sugar transport system permease subunit